MKFYNCEYTTYHNGTRINSVCSKCLLDEEPTNEELTLTWDNLDEMYYENGINFSFNIWNMKKGRLVSFFSNKIIPNGDFADVKEWKHPNLGIVVKVTYREYTPSIEKVLQWYDGERAIAYLKEKGLNI